MSKHTIRAAWAAVILATTFLGAADAKADRIVVLQFSGRKASVFRDKVAASLQRAGHTVIKSKVSSRRVSAKALKQAGKRADAVVGGTVEGTKKRDWRLTLRVSDPKQGTPIGEEIAFSSESLAGLTTEVSDNVSRRIETLLTHGEAAPAAAAEPAPAPPAIETKVAPVAAKARLEGGAGGGDDAASDDAAGGDVAASSDGAVGADEGAEDAGEESAAAPTGQGTFLRLSGRAGYVRRNFDFYDDLYSQLRKLGTNAWVYRARGELFPFKGSIGQHIGFVLSYEGVLSGSAHDLDLQVDYPVVHNEFFGGVRGTYPLGSYALGLELTFGRTAAGLDDGNGVARVPDLGYTELRSAIDVRRSLGAFYVAASVGLRLPIGFGEASETQWFPRMGGYGAEAGLELGYRLSKSVTLEAAGSLRRYLIEIHPEPADAVTGASLVAAGAVDRFLSGYLGATFAL